MERGEDMLTVNELFSGIGAFRKALIRLGIPHEIVGISEIDDFAIKSYEAIYGATRNYGDISKVKRLDYADMWTYGFPCQDISSIGQMKGIKKGETRSGLLYEVERLLITAKEENNLPKYLILENVKNLVGKFSAQFNEWLCILDDIGFNSYSKVMNAKNYGIPQNRERVFVVSIRKDIDSGFRFPDPVPLRFTFAEALENDVPEKYYLSPKYVQFLREHSLEMRQRGNGFVFEPFDRERERERESCAEHHRESRSTYDGQFRLGTFPLNAVDDMCKCLTTCSNTAFKNVIFGSWYQSGAVKIE